MADSSSVIRSKPVADQASDILRERIRSGFYRPDQRMPSEAQLADELHISRSSLRTALASLAAEGYIRRRHGDGTYTCPRSFQLTLRSGRGWDIERQIQQSGRKPSLRVLDMGRRPASPEESRRLGIPEGEDIFAIRRLVLADGAPVGLIESKIAVQGLAAEIPRAEGTLPPQEFLERHHERKPRDGEIRFFASLADEEMASFLDVRPGSLLLRLEGRYYDEARLPLLLMAETYRGEQGFELQAGFV